MFPSFILDKIYWYIWRNLQSTLCKEFTNRRLFVYQSGSFLLEIKNEKMTYNYRIWRPNIHSDWNNIYYITHKKIYTIKYPRKYMLDKHNQNPDLSNNYLYSVLT